MSIENVTRLQKHLLLHWMDDEVWLATRGYQILVSRDEGSTWQGIASLGKGRKLKAFIAGKSVMLGQAGRLGIHNLIRLAEGAILCVCDGFIYRAESLDAEFQPVFSDYQGRRFLRMGICEDGHGRAYCGEYWVNPERESVRLWRSDDSGLTWNAVHTWNGGEIRHIHLVQYDPHTDRLWIGTGDNDDECRIGYSTDGGETFTYIGRGAQTWRAVSLLFTDDSIYWGTDAGIDAEHEQNFVYRWHRAEERLEQVTPLPGPAYYSTQLSDHTLIIGTAVEGGANEIDNHTYACWSRDGEMWIQDQLWAKLPGPEVAGHAVLLFPRSRQPIDRLLLNVQFVRSSFNGALAEMILA